MQFDYSNEVAYGALIANWREEGCFVLHISSMVLSRAAVERIISSGIQCPLISAPDDMFLGGIAGQLGIHIIHSPLFHQVCQPQLKGPN